MFCSKEAKEKVRTLENKFINSIKKTLKIRKIDKNKEKNNVKTLIKIRKFRAVVRSNDREDEVKNESNLPMKIEDNFFDGTRCGFRGGVLAKTEKMIECGRWKDVKCKVRYLA